LWSGQSRASSPASWCREGFGLIGDIVIGILGALIVGFLFPYFGLALTLGGGVLGAIIMALIGAVILLVIVKVIKGIAA